MKPLSSATEQAFRSELLRGTEGLKKDSSESNKIIAQNVRKKVLDLRKNMTKAEKKEALLSVLQSSSAREKEPASVSLKESGDKLAAKPLPKKKSLFRRAADGLVQGALSGGVAAAKIGAMIGAIVGVPFAIMGIVSAPSGLAVFSGLGLVAILSLLGALNLFITGLLVGAIVGYINKNR